MFVGRENKLTKLEKMYSTNEFQFAVIYGRRRVGRDSKSKFNWFVASGFEEWFNRIWFIWKLLDNRYIDHGWNSEVFINKAYNKNSIDKDWMDRDTEWFRKMEWILKCYRTTGNEPGTLFRRVTFSQKSLFLRK